MARVSAEAAATSEAPRPAGRYSQAVVAGDFCFLAGQGPLAPDGSIVRESLEAQLRRCVENLEAVARAAGTDLSRAVRLGVYLRPGTDLTEYNRVYAELITADPPPARTTIFSDFTEFDVEIDAICVVP
jgi:2-iminobutanoate/2-iminopropanoate deaminase